MARSEPAHKVGPANEADERLLIEAAQQDRACFASIYERYFELVYAYVRRRVNDRAAAEDLTSDVFRKALAHLPRFKWTGAPFAAWLFRIASNMIADRAKRKAREGNPGSGPSAGVRLETPSLTQQSDLEDAERQAKLFKLVDDLADDQRRVIVMRFAEEMSLREIANELGRSEGAVKQLQFRALRHLREQLAQE